MIKRYLNKSQINITKKTVFCFFSSFVFSLGITSLSFAQSQEAATTKEVVDKEAKIMDLLSRIDVFAEEDERLRMDSAKAHYNMGNVYYEKGDYEVAAREYYQAVILMPHDPDVHYNLAYVSSEKLKDFETALEHYKMYLYLSPKAKDLHYVRKKILECELALRGKIDSQLDK